MSLLLALASGLLQGVAFLGPWAQPLGWSGLALLAVALRRAPRVSHALAALAVAALARQCVALHWWLGTARHYAAASDLEALGVAALGWLSTGLASQVPLFVLVMTPVRRWPVRFWLPGAWVLGEGVLVLVTGCSMTHWLYSQWALPPMLRALAYIGWVPLLCLCLYACAALGEALALRAPRLVAPLALVLLFLGLLPAIPADDAALQGLGVVHLAASSSAPGPPPPGTDWLIWPESTVRGHQRVGEGPLPEPRVLAAFSAHPPLPGLAGLTLRTPEGFFNAVGLFDASGRLLATRGKSVLVPLGERSMFGLRSRGETLLPGRASPVLSVEGRRVTALICYEAFSRETALRGWDARGQLLAVLSSDLPLVGSRVALEQSLGAAILRAVEFHVPVVRSSLGGVAAVVSSDGRVLARTAPATTGVLTVAPSVRVFPHVSPGSRDGARLATP